MTPCPTDEMLGALVQRALGGDEAAAVTSHLDDCASCREAVIAAVRGGVATTPRLGRGTPSLPVARDAGPALGTKIGRYHLRALLGAGGMGRVYEAHDTELDRAIA